MLSVSRLIRCQVPNRTGLAHYWQLMPLVFEPFSACLLCLSGKPCIPGQGVRMFHFSQAVFRDLAVILCNVTQIDHRYILL